MAGNLPAISAVQGDCEIVYEMVGQAVHGYTVNNNISTAP